MFPNLQAGRLLLYRLFDVADDIDLRQAEGLLRASPEAPRPVADVPGFLGGPDRPILLHVGTRALSLDGVGLKVDAFVRVFAHGVVSVRYELVLPSGAGAAEVAALLRRTNESEPLEQEARREAERVLAAMVPAAHGRQEHATAESYAVVFATAVGPGTACEDIEGEELARVLLGEPPGTSLSDQTVAHTTRHRFAYGRSDLCVLDWDSAFVLEPSGDRSVPDVLEVASSQLLELRHYDEMFEREILKVTHELDRPRRRLAWSRARGYRVLARRVQALVVESAEVVERVDNAVRFAGDLYLARVHRAAVERFRIDVWQSSVERRQQTMADVAGLLHDDATAQLGHVLEALILFFIVFELTLALFGWR